MMRVKELQSEMPDRSFTVAAVVRAVVATISVNEDDKERSGIRIFIAIVISELAGCGTCVCAAVYMTTDDITQSHRQTE